MLTGDKLQTIQDSLPYDHLALNFRDAITVTRTLDIRCQWIDSPCIIQYSKSDWLIESKKWVLCIEI